MSKRVIPNYDHSLLNIVHSILKHYGLQTSYPSLSLLSEALKTQPKNVVLMVFDGMGLDMIQKNLSEECWLNRYTKDGITSVYPCTTTAAMTSYYSGLSPLEHGWLGWSLYFKEYARTVDTFLNIDSYSKDSVGQPDAARTLLPFKTVFDQIYEQNNGDVQTFTIMPEGITVATPPTITLGVDTVDSIRTKLQPILEKDGRKYIMTYWYEPDHVMHIEGCYSNGVKKIIKELNDMVEALASSSKDTLFIVSADHGLCNIEETIYLEEEKDFCDLLLMPPTIEPRCTSFYIKADCHSKFIKRFNDRFGDDFILMSKKDFLDSAYLGKGRPHYKIDDFIGDYIAIGIGKKLLRYRTLNLTVDHKYLGHHAGQLEEEMMVPLILFRN